MKTVDKFGHYRGFHAVGGGWGLPRNQRSGLVMDARGHYNCLNKRLTNLGDPKDEQDAVTYKHVKKIAEGYFLHEKMLDFIPKGITEYMEKNKKEVLLPLIKEIAESTFKDGTVGWASETKKYIDEKVKSGAEEMKKDIKKSKEELKQFKKNMEKTEKEAQEELKSVTDMTRAFVYNVTSPGFKRNAQSVEDTIHARLMESNKTWRHAFPEVSGV